MLDFGWPELLVVALVLIIVVGPKDLPAMLRTFGRTTKKLRTMAGEFRSQFDQALKEAELDDVRQAVTDAQKLNPKNMLKDVVDPIRNVGNEIKSDLDKTIKAATEPSPEKQAAPDSEAAKPAVAEQAKDSRATAKKPAAKKPASKSKAAGAKAGARAKSKTAAAADSARKPARAPRKTANGGKKRAAPAAKTPAPLAEAPPQAADKSSGDTA